MRGSLRQGGACLSLVGEELLGERKNTSVSSGWSEFWLVDYGEQYARPKMFVLRLLWEKNQALWHYNASVGQSAKTHKEWGNGR